MTALVVGHEVLVGRLGLRKLSVSVGVGLLVSAVLALPVIYNIVSNPDFGKPIHFDFIAFLNDYYPGHFLINTTEPKQIIYLAIVVIICFLSLLRLGDPNRRMTAALAACVMLYMIGAALPWVTHAPSALNLHLLRSGTMIHLLAALLLSVVIVRWWFGTDNRQALAAAAMMVVIAVALVVNTSASRALAHLSFLAIVAVNGGALSPARNIAAQFGPYRRAIATGALVLAFVLSAVAVDKRQRSIAADEAWLSEWARVANWAHHETKEGAIFMPPVMAWKDLKSGRQDAAPYLTNTAFESISHRSIWVDWKRGAAVMWRPSYYEIWKTRMDEVEALKSFEEKESYAHGISYIIETPATLCGDKSIFGTNHLCVAKVD